MVSKKKIFGIVAVCVLVIGITLALVLTLVVFKKDGVKVKTKTAGTLVGKTVKLEDGKTEMYEFHNIPYTKPPVGELRFRPPVKLDVDASKTVSATDDTPVYCIQGDSGLGVEDCLVLSVRSGNLTASKPVIFWIHGGGLTVGNGMGKGYSFDSELTHQVDAVTVNINYRLGFLGFSSVEELWDTDKGDAGVIANNGIRDMIVALDWVQDNIAAFGGDPKSVTIIGESGGATAVLALVSSPLANDKFHAAIAQSPAPEMRFTHTKGNEIQRHILKDAGCNEGTSAEKKKCLLALPASKFSAAHGVASDRGLAYFEFPYSKGAEAEYVGLVMIDPTVVTVEPRKLKDASFTPSSPLPVIISNCAEENYNWTHWPLNPPFSSIDDLKSTLKPQFKVLNEAKEDLMDNALAIYPFNDNPTKIWSLMTCDMRSTCPSNDVAVAMSEAANRNIYRLYVSHKASNGVPAFHFYDSLALFGYEIEGFKFPAKEADIAFRNHYIKMLKKFSKDKKFDDGWETFPGKSMTYENSEEISKVESSKPEETQCTELTKLDLVKYGWQN